jgi:FKBP-type peptidyl-prolyl cis-trans isomerase SlyD
MRAQIVSFNCILRNKLGKVLSSTFNHDVITHVKGQEMLKGLAEGLQDLQQGERRHIHLSAEEAYGFYMPEMVVTQHRDEVVTRLPLQHGDQVLARTPQGEFKPFRVVQAFGEMITLDGNHPFAGQDLIFEIEAVAVRDATSQEISDSTPDTHRSTHLH